MDSVWWRAPWRLLWRVLLIVSWLTSLYFDLKGAPDEVHLGVSQRIFYPHIGGAWIGGAALMVTFVLSILYLRKRNPVYDVWAGASAEVGTMFLTTVLITGSIWGRVAWGTWWSWDPRLTMTILVWFLYLGYLLIREATDGTERRAVLASIYGIIIFVAVPIDYWAAVWWQSIHPHILTAQGFAMPPIMVLTLMLSLFAFTLFYIDLMSLRVRQAKLAVHITALKERLRDRL